MVVVRTDTFSTTLRLRLIAVQSAYMMIRIILMISLLIIRPTMVPTIPTVVMSTAEVAVWTSIIRIQPQKHTMVTVNSITPWQVSSMAILRLTLLAVVWYAMSMVLVPWARWVKLFLLPPTMLRQRLLLVVA